MDLCRKYSLPRLTDGGLTLHNSIVTKMRRGLRRLTIRRLENYV